MLKYQKIPVAIAILGFLYVCYQTAQFGGLKNVMAVSIGMFEGLRFFTPLLGSLARGVA